MTRVSTRRYLVASPCAPDSAIHQRWIASESRSFDLLLVNYSETANAHRADAEYYFEKRGFKLELLAYALRELGATLDHYDAVWLPDNDIVCTTADIERLFELQQRYQLCLAQPAIQGHFFHPIVAAVDGCVLRYVNFVEMMCPLFARDVLQELLDTFTLNRSGFGIDWLWAKLLRGRKVAILDAVVVEHSKPSLPDGPYVRRLEEEGIDAKREYLSLMFEHGLQEEYIEYSRVPRES